MAKTSTTIGPSAYRAWRNLPSWIRKEALLQRIIGKRLDLVPRQKEYLEVSEVEAAIWKIAALTAKWDEELGS